MTGVARAWIRIDGVTLGILLICVAIECILQLAEIGVINAPRLRLTVYEYGGFWPGLLRDWRPNYPAQPTLMFFTYSFLHGGLLHLLVNMVTLASLGRVVSDRVGPARYVAIYVLSILGGAIGYGLLASGLIPMVGASGALFGLAGAIIAWDARDRRADGDTLGPVYRLVALFAVLNIVLWWAMDGHLAWETHLGGFLVGAIAAIPLDRSSARSA